MTPLVQRIIERHVKTADAHAHLIQQTLAEAYKHGGYDAMMIRAYQIEAGLGPFSHIDQPRKYLADVLRDMVAKNEIGGVPVELSNSEKSRVHMYRDDLRRAD